MKLTEEEARIFFSHPRSCAAIRVKFNVSEEEAEALIGEFRNRLVISKWLFQEAKYVFLPAYIWKMKPYQKDAKKLTPPSETSLTLKERDKVQLDKEIALILQERNINVYLAETEQQRQLAREKCLAECSTLRSRFFRRWNASKPASTVPGLLRETSPNPALLLQTFWNQRGN